MNKLSVITLFGVCILLSGCGQDQYSIEQQYYWAKKHAEVILNDPHATPPSELQKSVDTFNQLILAHPKSNLAVMAQFNIADLYNATEEYKQARAQLNKIIKIYTKFPAICAQAVFLKGNTYEAQNQWDRALVLYKQVMKDYPLTMKSIEVPVYIAQHYKVKFQPDLMMQAYQDAIDHYNRLIEKYPVTPLSLRLNILVAQCYAQRKEWNNVVNTLDTVLEVYKNKVPLDGVMIDLAMIYDNQYKNEHKAQEILEQMIKEYPKSKNLPMAKSLLKKVSAK